MPDAAGHPIGYARPGLARRAEIVCRVERGRVELVGPEPSAWALWRELLVPAATIGTVALAAFIGGISALDRGPNPWPERSWTVNAMVAVAVVWMLAYLMMDAWLNAGVVTAMKYDGAKLSWTVQTLWGSRTRSWPAGQVKRVWAESLGKRRGILKVGRGWGVPVAAFSWRSIDDVRGAADLLAQAVFRRALD